VVVEPWEDDDLPLLELLLGDPVMMEHLGGPESREQIAERHERYLRSRGPADGSMLKIVELATRAAVGSVGYWERMWHDRRVWEVGWSVLPAFQGRGYAGQATAQVIDLVRLDGKLRFVHAFPAAGNAPSNAICRKLGFERIEECEFEYPPGHFMRCNDWLLDLLAEG
jgi:RimJ/RimL family protein N-acetyltransferase